MYQINPNESNFKFPNKVVLVIGDWNLGFGMWYRFSLLKNEFQKPKKLKESP
jgi:hypothetical protein